jgi:hypothetical protein
MSSADEPALIAFIQIAGRSSRCLDNVFFTSPMSESGQTEKDRHRRSMVYPTSNNGRVHGPADTADLCQLQTHALQQTQVRG